MNSKLFFILLLIIVGVAVFGMTAKSKTDTSLGTSTNDQNNKLTAQSKTMGAVDVEVKPVSIQSGEQVAFEVSMNTHSVELNYDYIQIVTLHDGQGNAYKPVEWTGESSGHHVSGQLIFPALPVDSKQLTLTLEGIDKETEDFSWQL